MERSITHKFSVIIIIYSIRISDVYCLDSFFFMLTNRTIFTCGLIHGLPIRSILSSVPSDQNAYYSNIALVEAVDEIENFYIISKIIFNALIYIN